MLKKTLLALAVASVASSASAMDLKVFKTDGTTPFTEANVLAVQTKQPVLDKTTLEATLDVTFDNSQADVAERELKNAGEIIFELDGEGYFNPAQVENLLTTVFDTDKATTKFTGVEIGFTGSAAGDADSYAVLEQILKITDDGNNAAISYVLDGDNKRLSLRLADTVQTVNQNDINLVLKLFTEDMKQGFKLISGSTSTVRMSVGALESASYTADPQFTPVLFKTANLFSVEQDALSGVDKTALVSTTYTNWTNPTDGALRGVKFTNNTTSQNIQYKHIKVSLAGDFAGISMKDGKLADKDGKATDWAVSEGKASALYSVAAGSANGNVQGGDDIASGVFVLPELFVAADNEVSIPAQNFALTVETIDNATFVPYSQTIGNAFVVVRDGMKFDTVTTGTSSSNVIYIRDVSKTLPEEGGKIFVTITEYAAHELENGGAGTDLVTRKELPVRLPSNGAVTLTPAGIAEALGVESTPSRQARFYFEVETNEGEAAVKKQTADGVDVQTGSIAKTDFTL